ncbi:MAG: propanediol utilization protein [Paracoccaceae bacterium]|nr:propanediol utilization protein [Paracoccaceae bacterium]
MTTAVANVTNTRISGHFGEWLQGRLGADGLVVLVSLTCPALGATARVVPGPAVITGNVDGSVADRFFAALGARPSVGMHVDTDAEPGAGAGMSTAALLALAGAAGMVGDVAQAALVAEGAVDPLHLADFDHVLWASREVRVVERFGGLPEFAVVGGFWGAPERTDPGDDAFPDVSDIVPMWRAAVAREDRTALAGLATEATRRTTALRGPKDDPTEEIAREVGALGIVRAHTGSARGLLFAPGQIAPGTAERLSEAGYADVLTFHTGRKS